MTKYQIKIAIIEPKVPGANGIKPMPASETKYFEKVITILLALL